LLSHKTFGFAFIAFCIPFKIYLLAICTSLHRYNFVPNLIPLISLFAPQRCILYTYLKRFLLSYILISTTFLRACFAPSYLRSFCLQFSTLNLHPSLLAVVGSGLGVDGWLLLACVSRVFLVCFSCVSRVAAVRAFAKRKPSESLSSTKGEAFSLKRERAIRATGKKRQPEVLSRQEKGSAKVQAARGVAAKKPRTAGTDLQTRRFSWLFRGYPLALDGKTLSTARPSRRQDPLDGKKAK
jgi:hypothetical protein